MKRLCFILVGLVIMVSLIVSGCASSPTPTTTAPKATTSAPATSTAPAAKTTVPATTAPKTTAPATSAAPKTTAPATTPAAGVITLKFAFDMPTTGAIVPGWTQYFGPEL